MYTVIPNIRIKGICASVSNHWVSIKEVSEEPDEVLKKFTKNTGVEGRWVAGEKQTASDFCYYAAEKLLSENKIEKSEIGVLVFVSQTPDYYLPSTACVLQNRLGIGKDCIAFDVNLSIIEYFRFKLCFAIMWRHFCKRERDAKE